MDFFSVFNRIKQTNVGNQNILLVVAIDSLHVCQQRGFLRDNSIYGRLNF